jgi:hypothetical protein
MSDMRKISEKEKEFLIGLEKISRETGVIVEGCGCCGSPSLRTLDSSDMPPEAGYAFGNDLCEIAWLSPRDGTNWEYYRNNIVKVQP